MIMFVSYSLEYGESAPFFWAACQKIVREGREMYVFPGTFSPSPSFPPFLLPREILAGFAVTMQLSIVQAQSLHDQGQDPQVIQGSNWITFSWADSDECYSTREVILSTVKAARRTEQSRRIPSKMPMSLLQKWTQNVISIRASHLRSRTGSFDSAARSSPLRSG